MKKLIMVLVLVVIAVTALLITTMTLTTDGKTNECDSESTWVCISYDHNTGECEKYGKKNLGCNDTFIPAII